MKGKNAATLLGVCSLLTAGGILASNMAFKVNYPLLAAGSGSISGTNTMGLPDIRQVGLNSAGNLINDIGFPSVKSISKCLVATDSLQVYTGRMGSPSPDFALSPTECYFIQMNTTVNYTIWGSHDPLFARQLLGPGPGSKTGTNCYAPPTNAVARNALELMKDIEGAGPPFGKVVSIQKFLVGSGAVQVYTGRMGSPGANFNLVPGECYKIQMSQTVSYSASYY